MSRRSVVVAFALTACGRIGFGDSASADASADAIGAPRFPLVLPDGGVISQLVIAPDGTWYARTPSSGLYRSTNQGVMWTPCVSGPPASGIGVGPDSALYATGTTTRISADRCDSFTNLGTSRYSNNAGAAGSFAYAMTDQGIERRDTGAWTTVLTVPGIAFGAFDSRDGGSPALVAGSANGVYTSDAGASWTSRTTGFYTLAIRGVAVGAAKTYAITGATQSSSGGISCGNADGSVWTMCRAYGGTAIAVDPTDDDHVLAAIYDDFAETTDAFATPPSVARRGASGLSNAIINDIDFTEGGDAIVSTFRGVYVSPAGPLAFQPRNGGLYAWTPARVLVDGDDMFVATEAGLARSLGGAALAIDTPGIPQDVAFRDVAIAASGDILGVGRGIWRSTDRGATWSQIYSFPGTEGYHGFSIELDNGRIYAGTDHRLTYADPPYSSWLVRDVEQDQQLGELLVVDGELWVGATMGLYVSAATDVGRDVFTRIADVGGNVMSIAVLSTGGLLVGTTTGIYASDPTRTMWTSRSDASTRTVFTSGRIVLAATSQGVLASRDEGESWTKVPESDGLGTRGLAIDPGSGEVIYGVAGRGLERAAIP